MGKTPEVIEQIKEHLLGTIFTRLPFHNERGTNGMTAKKRQATGEMNVDRPGKETDATVNPPARIGRPKQNPHAEDKKLTIRIPVEVHRKLRYASVDLDKPMVEIAVDALIAYLAKHEA